jgi:hypothetical protein
MRNETWNHLQKSAIIRLGPQVSDSVSTLAHAQAPLPCSTGCQETAAKLDDSRLLLRCALASIAGGRRCLSTGPLGFVPAVMRSSSTVPAAADVFLCDESLSTTVPWGFWLPCIIRLDALRWWRGERAFRGRLRRCPTVAPGILCQAPARSFHGWLFRWRDRIRSGYFGSKFVAPDVEAPNQFNENLWYRHLLKGENGSKAYNLI